jgi:hypothetical protein
METACIRDPREIDAATGIDAAMEAHTEFRQLAQVMPPLPSPRGQPATTASRGARP